MGYKRGFIAWGEDTGLTSRLVSVSVYVYIERNKKVKKLYAHHTSCKYLKTEDHHVLVSSNDACKV